jgi:hypothetical protein
VKTRGYFKEQGLSALSLFLIWAFLPRFALASVNEPAAPSERYDLMPIGAVVLQPDGRILLADGCGMSLRFVDESTGLFGRISGGVFRLHLEMASRAVPATRPAGSVKMEELSETVWISALELQEAGAVVEMKGRPNTTYVLQATDAPGSGDWTVIATSTTDGSGAASFHDVTPPNQPVRVYRICSMP